MVGLGVLVLAKPHRRFPDSLHVSASHHVPLLFPRHISREHDGRTKAHRDCLAGRRLNPKSEHPSFLHACLFLMSKRIVNCEFHH